MHVVTASEMYEIDRFTMNEIGIPGVVLMENAGRAVTYQVKKYLMKETRAAVLIGTGNNGGDGIVIARTLLSEGYNVDVWLVPAASKLKGDAKLHLDIFRNAGFDYRQLESPRVLNQYDCLIDAMLGIGMNGSLRSPYKEVIAYCNQLEACKIAVDIPSGLPADENQPFSIALQASATITLQCPKQSAFVFPAASYYGELSIVDIGIPKKAEQAMITKKRMLWQKDDAERKVLKRVENSHKGTYGKGLVIGGSTSMTGAPIMTAKAAHRSGAGLVTVAIPKCIHTIVAGHLVESTFSSWEDQGGFFSGHVQEDLENYNAVALGPGMGRTVGGSRLLETVLLEFEGPLLIDADGLFHIKDKLATLKRRKAPTILTPHVGEMSRLLNVTSQEVEARRFDISYQFAKEHGVYLVLKGPYTLITTPEGHQYVNTSGNPALAKGGSGDVLTGMILAFVMNQNSLSSAICNSVYFHGKAAEVLTQTNHSTIDVIASDVIEVLPTVFRTAF